MSDKIIHLFRHAESDHQAGPDMLDPFLAVLGIRQARSITQPDSESKEDDYRHNHKSDYNPFPYRYLKHPTLILTSPLRRCIQTVLYAFHPSFNPDAAKIFSQPPRIIALPHLQEAKDYTSNTGSPVDQLEKWFGKYVTFPEGLWEHWPKRDGTPFEYRDDLCAARAHFVHEFILQQPENEIIIMSHGEFCHFVVNQWADRHPAERWFQAKNAEGFPMKLVKKEDSKGTKIIWGEEKTGLYQLQVFDELKDEVDSRIRAERYRSVGWD